MARSKTPEDITPEYLTRSALHYVQSRETTADAVRQMLRRRVMRICKDADVEVEDYEGAIDQAVAYVVEKSYVNDDRFTERFVELSQEKGLSRRQVQAKLHQKGVDPDTVQEYLESDDPYDDLQAAMSFARKKRIGMFRGPDRYDHRDRDLAKLARRGFRYETCSKIVDGNDETETWS